VGHITVEATVADIIVVGVISVDVIVVEVILVMGICGENHSSGNNCG
jgi:hypothetical protein